MFIPILEAMTMEQVLEVILLLGMNLGAVFWVLQKQAKKTR
ncbi:MULTISPECIES: hypothetical protein [Bacillales]|nr:MULTISPECIES: hypothetical protein [Bacillales]